MHYPSSSRNSNGTRQRKNAGAAGDCGVVCSHELSSEPGQSELGRRWGLEFTQRRRYSRARPATIGGAGGRGRGFLGRGSRSSRRKSAAAPVGVDRPGGCQSGAVAGGFCYCFVRSLRVRKEIEPNQCEGILAVVCDLVGGYTRKMSVWSSCCCEKHRNRSFQSVVLFLER
jgi:hypothetical protein